MFSEPLDTRLPVEACAQVAVRRSLALALSSSTAGIFALLVGLLASNVPGLTFGITVCLGAALFALVGGPFLVLYQRPPAGMLQSYSGRIEASRRSGNPARVVSRQGVALMAVAAFAFALVLVLVVLVPQLPNLTGTSEAGASLLPPKAPPNLSAERIRSEASSESAPITATFGWPDGLHLRASGERSLSLGRERNPTQTASAKYTFQVDSTGDASGVGVVVHGARSTPLDGSVGAAQLAQLFKRDIAAFERLGFRVSSEGKFIALLDPEETQAQLKRAYAQNSIGEGDFGRSVSEAMDPRFAEQLAAGLWQSWVGSLIDLANQGRAGRCGAGAAIPDPTTVIRPSQTCVVAHAELDCGDGLPGLKCIRVEIVNTPDRDEAARNLSRQFRQNGLSASVSDYDEESVGSVLLRTKDLVPVKVESWTLQQYTIVLDSGARSRQWKADHTKLAFVDETRLPNE
jgi:hypothetical protein